MSGQPISAITQAEALHEAERADTVEQRFREELPVLALDGNGTCSTTLTWRS
jgi:hypothetical protein